MKKTLLLLLITLTTFAQKEKVSIGLNVVPLALNRTFDIPVEYRFDSTKSITVNLGATFNNTQDYAICFQCAGRPLIKSLDAFALKINYRKYYKSKRKSQKFYGLGAVMSYYDKDYDTGANSGPDLFQKLSKESFFFSPNLQLGRSLFLSKSFNLDFGTQLNFPVKYKGFVEPPHYTPTRGMGIINFFFVLKFKFV